MQLNIEKQLFSWWIKCHVLHICSDVSGQGQDKSIKLVNPLFWGHMLGTLCPVLIKTLWMRHLKAWNGDLFSAGWGNEASEERTCSGCHTKTGPTPLTPSCTLHLFFVQPAIYAFTAMTKRFTFIKHAKVFKRHTYFVNCACSWDVRGNTRVLIDQQSSSAANPNPKYSCQVSFLGLIKQRESFT